MASQTEKDNFCIRFTGKNYPAWEFQFRMYVKGKGLWNHLDDISMAPLETTDLDAWEIKDAQIITWILSIIDPQMINNLRSFSTAQEMWNYLKQHSAIIHVDVPKSSLTDVQEVYNTSRRDQFLMKLRPEFEVVRGALLNRNPVPSLDTRVGELL
ncbi:uncharacterized protein LOC131605232 [Vicia villosa]|uniref:uncharacterized protein LOC131605232 n=1 Tax=Vicia villosa TaxID=3911 RepID=UPI00273BC9AD|nr:uncharacterized protein LOC131605232 [Vicia villosa]